MDPENLTLTTLKEILEEANRTHEQLEGIHSRLSGINERIDETNSRIDQVRDELSRRIEESGMRTATAITSLACSVDELLNQERDLRRPKDA